MTNQPEFIAIHSNGGMNSHVRVGNNVPYLIANSYSRWRGIFKGLSQDWGTVVLFKNLRASLFHKDLSIDTTFS